MPNYKVTITEEIVWEFDIPNSRSPEEAETIAEGVLEDIHEDIKDRESWVLVGHEQTDVSVERTDDEDVTTDTQ